MRRKRSAKSRIAALAAALTMAVTAFTAPAYADNTPVKGPTLTFDKYLVLDETANVPNAEFGFTVSAGQAADAASTTPKVNAGIDANLVEVSKAKFAPDMETSDTAPEGSGLSLAEGEVYAAAEVTVDFSKVQFTEPGLYRYEIRESATDVPGVTADSSVYYIDIAVVTDDNGKLTIMEGGVGMNNGTQKVTSFTNKFGSTSLTLGKTVTGNQGDRNKEFEFTVEIENAPIGSVYNVTLPEGGNASNKAELTVGNDGTVTATYYLKHNQSIVINGLTKGVTYTITEEIEDGEGYETSNTVDSAEMEEDKTTGAQTMGEVSQVVNFTNHREGTVPTGVLLDVAPYAALVMIAGAAFAALMISKKRRAER